MGREMPLLCGRAQAGERDLEAVWNALWHGGPLSPGVPIAPHATAILQWVLLTREIEDALAPKRNFLVELLGDSPP